MASPLLRLIDEVLLDVDFDSLEVSGHR